MDVVLGEPTLLDRGFSIIGSEVRSNNVAGVIMFSELLPRFGSKHNHHKNPTNRAHTTQDRSIWVLFDAYPYTPIITGNPYAREAQVLKTPRMFSLICCLALG